MSRKKTALVLEGGAIQGVYTAGVLDVLMEHEIEFDGIIGVSAGALFGVNYLSKQIGRVIRYNKRFNAMKGYMGVGCLIKTGNIVSTNLAYDFVPRQGDPFDNETYKSSDVPFYAVLTNIETGLPEYVRITDVFEQMDTLRASGSMPFVSTPVKLNGKLYLDGAVTDSIPYKYMLDNGYDRVLAVLTKDITYVKKPISPILSKTFYKKKYPKLEEKIRNRHIMYNEQKRNLHELEAKGIADVIRPSKPMYISKLEKDVDKMEALYQLGRQDGETFLRSQNGSIYN